MYIKKVTKKNGVSNKVYTYLHLVENVRTVKGPRQKFILNLGDLPNIDKSQYKTLSNRIENILTGQSELFDIDPAIDKLAQSAVKKIFKKQASEKNEETTEYKNVDVNSINAGNVRSLGPEYVCTQIWNELEIDKFLIENKISHNVIPIMKALVIGRMIEPGSELSTKNWAEKRSSLYELTGSPLRDSLNSYYRAGDKLFSLKTSLEDYLRKKEQNMFSLNEKIILYDLTNTYFEGTALKNEKAKFGRSKEKRTDCKLITLGLILDENGFVKTSKLFAGNQSEGATLPDMISSLEQKDKTTKNKKTVVLDAGIAIKSNIEWLEKNKYDYVVVNRGKVPFEIQKSDDFKPIYNPKKKSESEVVVYVKRYKKDKEVYILCHSKNREAKEKSMRDRIEQLFLENLEKCTQNLNLPRRTKNYRNVCEKIGRLKEKYPKIAKLYKIEVIPEQNTKKKLENLNAVNIKYEKTQNYIKEQKKEGHYVLKTNRDDLSDEEIWNMHNMLIKVESSFRYLKSDLGLRPNFHQKEARVDAHMFISVLAYHILHIIEYRLALNGYNKSWKTIRRILQTHSRLTIYYNSKNEDVLNSEVQINQLRICSKVEPEQIEIYNKLGISTIPLNKKIFTQVPKV